MTICFLTNALSIEDGGGRLSFDLTAHLKKSGQKIIVLTHDGLIKNLCLNFFKIRKILKNSDIIHAIDIWPNGFYARLISLGLNKQIVITALGTYSVIPFYSWRWLLVKWILRNAQLIAISDYTKEKILEVMPDKDIEVIPPGFDLDFWSNTKDQQPDEKILKYKPYILSVGALKPRKGYINLIKAFDIVGKKFEKLNYVIVGQGEDSEYVKELKKLIKENNLENKVFFISSSIDDNQLLGFYKNAELFVLTPVEENYHFEGFGIVYLEAAASGLPIIASYKSGATSAVKESYNGIFVPQNNPKATAGAMIKIISDEIMKTKLKNNGREWVKEFSWEKIIKKYIKIYNVKHH